MYNKLFTKILDSSIWLSPDPHRLVWITLIAAMDEDSIAHFACPENLAARARVSLEDTKAALAAFESPDTFDPTQEHEGRRIERIPGGYFILNGAKYRNLVTKAHSREMTRERTRRWRERKNGDASVTPVTPVTIGDVPVTPSESYADAKASSEAPPAPKPSRNALRDKAETAWLHLIATSGVRIDEAAEAGVQACGGWAFIRMRTEKDGPMVRERFLNAYIEAKSKAPRARTTPT